MGRPEDYIETVLTCEGDFYDPEFQNQLELFSERLQSLISSETDRHIVLKKVEPWNSVKVTFNIPKEAAMRLKLLAEEGSQTLRDLGILSVQIEGNSSIALTIAGKNNEPTEIVFRTSDPVPSALPPAEPASGFKPLSTDVLQLAGQAGVDTSRKNIASFLEQGQVSDSASRLLDIFGQQQQSVSLCATEISIPHHGVAVHPSLSLSDCGLVTSSAPQRSLANRAPPSYTGMSHIPVTIPGNFHSPGSQLSPASPKYPTPPPSVSNPNSPGIRTPVTFPISGGSHAHVNAVVNNMVRLIGNKDITSSSPLLVNLLQNDANAFGHLNNLAQQGRLQFPFDPVAPPPKKKKVPTATLR